MLEPLLSGLPKKIIGGGIFSLNGNDYINHGSSNVTLTNKGGVTIGPDGYVFNKTTAAKLFTNSVDEFDFQGNFRIEIELTHKVGSNVYFEHILGTGDGINGNGWCVCVFNSRISFGTSQSDILSSSVPLDTSPMTIVIERTETLFTINVRGTPTTSNAAAILTKKHKQAYPLTVGDRQDGSAYGQYPLNATIRRLEIFV